MAFDGITIQALLKELREKLLDSRVTKIQQTEKEELFLTFKKHDGENGNETFLLLISANASLPVIYFAEDSKNAPLQAPAFCMLLRKHLQNARVQNITTPGMERILDFHFSHLDEMGDLREKHLIVELMGKYSNIIFTDENRIILDAVRRVPPTLSSVRTVLPRAEWFVPETSGRKDPLTVSVNEFEDLLNKGTETSATLRDFILGNFTGFSNDSLDALLDSDFSSDDSLETFNSEKRAQFCDRFFRFMSDVREGNFSPFILYEKDLPKLLSVVPLNSYSDEAYEKEYFDSVSELLKTFYAKKNFKNSMKQRSQDLLKFVHTLLERASKKLDLQLKQYHDTDALDSYKLFGELLTAYAYQLKDGEKKVTLENYNDDNRPVEISLDPRLSIRENANRFYEKYNKLKRTREALEKWIPETSQEMNYLKTVDMSLQFSENQEDIDLIRDELREAGYLKKMQQKKGPRRTRKSTFLHYVTEDGFHLYVGKNNFQNDDLTFHFADSNDLWFHVKKVPGSHVILKYDGREIPDDVYMKAGNLAAFYSSVRESDKAEVDYIEKKFLKKPNGAPLGFVIYHTNYSLMATPALDGLTLVPSLSSKN